MVTPSKRRYATALLAAPLPDIPRPALLDGSFHHHLLRDTARLHAWADAVRAAVRPGDVVADLGSGSGILSYVAAKAGARKVHAVEMNTHSYKALLRTVRQNGMTGAVVPTLGDGTQWKPSERVDVVICELMETGLLHESIAAVMRNVRGWPEPPRAIVPKGATLLVEGVRVEDEFLGYRAAFPGFRATGEGEPALTDAAAYATYDFEREAPPESIDAAFRLTATADGAITGLQLRTRTLVGPGIEIGGSPAYCTPLVLTLEEAVEVRVGDRLVGRVAYDFDYTAKPLTFELRRA